MFSVVIPLYNKELSIKNTIQSVLEQSFQEFEIIVVNDGSTDKSASVVESIHDERIRLVHQNNQGVSVARNRGVREARYNWIVFLDGDDLWEENHLSTFAEMIMKYPNDKVFCTSHSKSKYKGGYVPKDIGEYEIIDDYFEEVMKHVDFIWTSATCINKSVFDNVGGFPVGINRGEDLDLWARIGKQYRIIRSRTLTAIYRLDSENKLTGKRSKYGNSILSIIDLKGKKGNERVYFKKMIYKRLKADLRYGDFKELIRLLYKHNIELLK